MTLATPLLMPATKQVSSSAGLLDMRSCDIPFLLNLLILVCNLDTVKCILEMCLNKMLFVYFCRLHKFSHSNISLSFPGLSCVLCNSFQEQVRSLVRDIEKR